MCYLEIRTEATVKIKCQQTVLSETNDCELGVEKPEGPSALQPTTEYREDYYMKRV